MTRTAVEAFFERYVEAFSRGDANGVQKAWDFPATISTPDANHVLDAPEFLANTEALCGFYARQGVAEAKKTLVDICPLSADTAAVTTEDRVFDSDGKAITAWRHGYILRERGNAIRAIVAIADGEIEAWAARGTPMGKN